MKPISSVEEGISLIDSFKGKAEELVLAVFDSLLDPVGLNMASDDQPARISGLTQHLS